MNKINKIKKDKIKVVELMREIRNHLSLEMIDIPSEKRKDYITAELEKIKKRKSG